VSAAKVAAAAAAQRAVRTALQVHGGIGYTDELDLHLWFARVWSLRTTWGDDRVHRARLCAALLGESTTVRLP
jgi:alkylation response protein AidB-like acyl-CoA dehydrogenase